jgi:hypothetical protein
MEFPDGLEELRRVISLKEIASMIERTARWVSPETFRLLPVWFPEHSRRGLFYKGNWSEKQTNTNRLTGQSIHKYEGNIHANKALTLALGISKKQRPNWSCCHIWGVDDPTYQLSNSVVQDSRFFSCVANMVLLPTPLKAFTDALPDIKAMLRICALNLYGWKCEHEELHDAHSALAVWNDWDSYPASWPKYPKERLPQGTVSISPTIRASAEKRLSEIRRDLHEAGPHYPREQVKTTLNYWNVAL